MFVFEDARRPQLGGQGPRPGEERAVHLRPLLQARRVAGEVSGAEGRGRQCCQIRNAKCQTGGKLGGKCGQDSHILGERFPHFHSSLDPPKAGCGRWPASAGVRHLGLHPHPAAQGAQGHRLLRRIRQGWKEVAVAAVAPAAAVAAAASVTVLLPTSVTCLYCFFSLSPSSGSPPAAPTSASSCG